jgi:2-oxoglutarate ferredoxin oxidoreductase subunit beta
MIKILEKAITHKGFSVVEVLSQCPTYFGRKNKFATATDMMNHYRTHTTPIGSKEKETNPDLIERGIFIQEKRPEYCAEYAKVIETASQGER